VNLLLAHLLTVTALEARVPRTFHPPKMRAVDRLAILNIQHFFEL
jgi:hypothetical protein